MVSDLKRVSGLWLKDGRNGKFMSGETNEAIPAGTRLLVFRNSKKVAGDKQPDYTLSVAPPDPASDRGPRANGNYSRDSRSGGQQPDQSNAPPAPAPPPYDESAIPF
jgi:hypothetical protein